VEPVEADVLGVESDALRAEIRRQGMTAHVVKQRTNAPFPRDILGGESVPLDACVVFLGTHPLMRHIQLHRRWNPGGWCNFERLRCSTYYAYFGPHLLNRTYSLLPGVEAIRQADRLFEQHAKGGEVFVRPDSVWKIFPGARVKRASFEQALAPSLYDPTNLVVVAEPRDIGREWRLVVAHGAVVAASQYYEAGVMTTSPGCPAEVRGFGERVLREVSWRPDPLFMLDIGESVGELRVVELNSFSCSGLYQCDKAAVVAAAAEEARRAAGMS